MRLLDAAGGSFLAALVARALRGALPPVDFRAVCLVMAMIKVICSTQKPGGISARTSFNKWDESHKAAFATSEITSLESSYDRIIRDDTAEPSSIRHLRVALLALERFFAWPSWSSDFGRVTNVTRS